MATISLKTIWSILTTTVREWLNDRVPQLGAALAFYTALSIAPLLVISLAIGTFFFGEQAAQGEISAQLQSLIGGEGAKAVEAMIANADKPASGAAAALVGVTMLLVGASGVFGELQQSLNIIWEVQPKPGRRFFTIVRDRFFSFVMVLGIAFLLLVSLVLSAVLAALGQVFAGLPQPLTSLAQGANFGASFVVITLLFAMMFKFLPDVMIAWRQVWVSAALTAILFTVGKFLIGLYIGHSGVASSYGVAGSFVALLVWVYYSAQILYFGAELTKVGSKHFGIPIKPAAHAELVRDAESHGRKPASDSAARDVNRRRAS